MDTWRKSETFADSLGYAWSGMKAVWKNEPNIRRQIGIAVLVIVVAMLLRLPSWDLLLLLMVSAIVLALEVVNSALELLLDVLHPGFDERLKVVKDMLAAAVLLMSVMAALLGVYLLGVPLIALVAGYLN